MEDSITSSICLSICEDYSGSWKLWEGVRELVQNWYDGAIEMRESIRQTLYPLKIEVKKKSQRNVHTYVASVDVPRANETSGGQKTYTPLGEIHFDESTQRLTLVNHRTTLARKVLLLGYSKKARCEDVIGQFGEGLKVGALALLREGRRVFMETSKDRWEFCLQNHSTFQDTRVLTVNVTDRTSVLFKDDFRAFPDCPIELDLGDTCTSLWPIKREEWHELAKRFLFLERPREVVQTEQGSLIMDSHMAGQLYVKGIWVNDFSKEGLHAGADMTSLRLDRDRRAIVHRSDIEHQVSSMWAKAIDQKPQWVNRYYQLLSEGSSCDVRQASFYVDDKRAAGLVAQEFFRKHGTDAFPLINTAAADMLRKFSNDLKKEVILCNQTLLDILIRSGQVPTADSLLNQHRENTKVKIPIAELRDDQKEILEHASSLIRLVEPAFTTTIVDIVETEEMTITSTGHRIEVPSWMLERDSVAGLYAEASRETFFAEANLALAILPRVPSERRVRGDLRTTAMIAALSAQAHEKADPFCRVMHERGMDMDQLGWWKERERQLHEEAQRSQSSMRETEERHRQKLEDLSATKDRLDKKLAEKETAYDDVRKKVEHDYEARLRSETGEYKSLLESAEKDNSRLQEENLLLRKRCDYFGDEQKKMTSKLDDQDKKMERVKESLQTRIEQLNRELLRRMQTLAKEYSDLNKSPDDEKLAEKIKELRDIGVQLKEMTGNDGPASFCVVCTQRPHTHVMVPCGHFCVCETCYEDLKKFEDQRDKCPMCKTKVETVIKVFVS